MVHLVLYSPKANSSSKYFPYHGYLGLTPLRVEGVVRTKFDEDNRPLSAKSISVAVRCYEYRLGRVSVLASHLVVDQSQVLWQKPDNQDYEDIGDLEFPFRITLPPTTPGFSTVHFQDYRVFWKVEAVLLHAPISGIGSRQLKSFELPLIRYDLPSPLVSAYSLPPLLTSLSSPGPSSPDESSPQQIHPPLSSLQPAPPKLRTGPVRYAIQVPRGAIGPMDLVSVGVWVGVEDGVTVKSVEVVVERRIEVRDGEPATDSTASVPQTPTTPTAPSTTSGSSSLTATPSAYTTPHASPSTSGASTTPSMSTMDTYHSYTSESPLLRPPASSSLYASSSASSASSSTLTLTTTGNLSPNLTSPTTTPTSPPFSPGHTPTKLHAHYTHITSTTSSHLTLLPKIPSTSPPNPSPGHLPHPYSGLNLNVFSNANAHGLSVFTKTLTLQWPTPRSSSRWGLGESMRGVGGDVRFFVKVKATLQNSYGTDTLDLTSHASTEYELLIVPTNEAQRQVALAKYHESRAKPKSKSKSPRRFNRTEREREEREREREREQEQEERERGGELNGNANGGIGEQGESALQLLGSGEPPNKKGKGKWGRSVSALAGSVGGGHRIHTDANYHSNSNSASGSSFGEGDKSHRDRDRDIVIGAGGVGVAGHTTISATPSAAETLNHSPHSRNSSSSSLHQSHPQAQDQAQVMSRAAAYRSSYNPRPSPTHAQRRKAGRRPHTSAGPRDHANERELGAGVGVGMKGAFYTAGIPVPVPVPGYRGVGKGLGGTSEEERERRDRELERKEREWEEELVRIEARSRRSSQNMLAFFGRKLKVAPSPGKGS